MSTSVTPALLHPRTAPRQSILRKPLSIAALVWMLLDPLLIVVSLVLASTLISARFGTAEFLLALVAFSLAYPGRPPERLVWSDWREIVIGWTLLALILAGVGYALGLLGLFERRTLLTWGAMVPLVLFAAHRLVLRAVPRLAAIEGVRNAVIVGSTAPGRRLAELFAREPALGVRLLGVFDERRDAPDATGPWLGEIDALAGFVRSTRVEIIYISLPMAAQAQILQLLDELRDTTASIYFVPDIFVFDLIQGRVDAVGGVPLVAVCETPFVGLAGIGKRAFDIGLTVAALPLLTPLMIAIAVGVRLSSRGPVIFRQRRYGLDGREIVVWKFRSMYVTEDQGEIRQATRGDARVTPFGAFLRRTSLDELPQFINVLQGRMSLVGPRPHAVSHNESYRRLIKGYMVRHKVRPGITGLAQVNGLRGEADTLDKMRARIETDLEYLRNWSARLDLAILWRTLTLLVRGDRNAY